MEQTLDMMRKRHEYFTQLISEHQIHTAREFCDILGKMFEIFGVEVSCGEGYGEIYIEFEGYDYENYKIIDGVDGKLATIDNIVMWNDPVYLCSDAVNIFKKKDSE